MFIGLPFAYFYYEDYDEVTSRRKRAILGLKVAAFLALIVGILIIVGVYVRTGSSNGQKSAPQYVWYKTVRESCGLYPSGIGFVMGLLILLGYLVWMFYTAYGLSGLPIGLMVKKKKDSGEYSEAQVRLKETRKKKSEITSRYASGAKITKKDRERIALLENEEKVYEQHATRLLQETTGGWAALTSVVGPAAIVMGVVFIVISIFVVISLLMTQIEKIMYPYCGASCGYFFTLPHTNNPIDSLLIATSKVNITNINLNLIRIHIIIISINDMFLLVFPIGLCFCAYIYCVSSWEHSNRNLHVWCTHIRL